MGEFELISRFFQRPAQAAEGANPRVALGIGDDCALLNPAEGNQLAITTDLLVEGRHFLSTVPPDRLGHKSLAVNLSDLAAMGATPSAFTLSLALPRADERWCAEFSKGLFALADAAGCTLIGGDTTASPVITISITAFGEVPVGAAITRAGAHAGDDIYVSHPEGGGIGDARLALEVQRAQAHLVADAFDRVRLRMELPTPRNSLGVALRGIATAMIDVSDGLLGDLNHILERSHLGARVEADAIARSPALCTQPVAMQRLCTLAGGDDYELLFTAPPSTRAAVLSAAHASGVAVARIGRIETQPGTRLVDARGYAIDNIFRSFDHFGR